MCALPCHGCGTVTRHTFQIVVTPGFSVSYVSPRELLVARDPAKGCWPPSAAALSAREDRVHGGSTLPRPAFTTHPAWTSQTVPAFGIRESVTVSHDLNHEHATHVLCRRPLPLCGQQNGPHG